MIQLASAPNPQTKSLSPDAIPALTSDQVDAAVLAQLTEASLLASVSELSISEWDDLFDAVQARLSASVGELFAQTPGLQSQDVANRVQAVVLECVGALDQLHAALNREREQRRPRELDDFGAQTAVALALAEFVGTASLPLLASCEQPLSDMLEALAARPVAVRNGNGHLQV